MDGYILLVCEVSGRAGPKQVGWVVCEPIVGIAKNVARWPPVVNGLFSGLEFRVPADPLPNDLRVIVEGNVIAAPAVDPLRILPYFPPPRRR